MRFSSKLLAPILLVASSCANAGIGVCLPPECSAPAVVSGPVFGWGDKLAMALTLPAAWMLVNGFFLWAGIFVKRRPPWTVASDPAKLSVWRQIYDFKPSPDELPFLRSVGFRMFFAGALLAALLVGQEIAEKPDDVGSTLAAEWSAAGSLSAAVPARVVLAPDGNLLDPAGGRVGRWSSTRERLRLVSDAKPHDAVCLWRDAQRPGRFWSLPSGCESVVEHLASEPDAGFGVVDAQPRLRKINDGPWRS